MGARIYAADATALEDAALFASAYRLADAKRREKTDRLRRASDRRASLCVHALLRNALVEMGVDPDEPIDETTFGKPYLLNRPDVRFNLSHSDDRALCVAASGEVGCDVEAINSAELVLADRVLTDVELDRLEATVDENERRKLLCRYWTLKESLMKAKGLGFALDPKSFAVALKDDEDSFVQIFGDEFYSFHEYDLGDGYCRACCVQNGSAPTELVCIDLTNLIKGI